MDWTGLGLREDVIKWLEAAAKARYAQDRRLDPFATSMRDFDDASAHLKAIRNGNPPPIEDTRQRITDLKNAGLVVAGGEALTKLGSVVLDAWERYGVDSNAKADELGRLLLMVLEAQRIDDKDFQGFLDYWADLRTHFAPLELIDSWDALYQINYLDFERDGFLPGSTYRDEKVAVSDIEFDLADYARSTAAGNLSIKGGERIENAIGGKLPRGRHRATFCMALEIVASDGQSSAAILEKFGFPKSPRVWSPFNETQKAKIQTILVDYGADKAQVEEAVAEGSVDAVGEPLTPSSKPTPALPENIDYSNVLVGVPRPKGSAVREPIGKGTGAKKIDHKQKAHTNDAIGKLGEDFAVAYERWRLREHPELLKKLRHVSKEDDTLGYDIESFELDGTPRYIEVKGTLGPIDTRFYLTANEISCAATVKEQYVILRVAHLATKPQCCEVRYPFDGKLEIVPATYIVGFVAE